MRFLFKTDYEDDIRLMPPPGYVFSCGILLALLVIAPFVLSSYIVSQLVFVCIYATVGVGLMILTGFTGQASLGHAALSCHRRLCRRLSTAIQRAVPGLFPRRRAVHRRDQASISFPALQRCGRILSSSSGLLCNNSRRFWRWRKRP